MLCSPTAFAQTLGGGQTLTIGWWRIALGLLFCLVLSVVAAVVLKRRGFTHFGRGQTSSARVKIIEITRLNHRSELNLISCDGTHFLIAVSPSGTRLIGQVEKAETPQAPLS